MPNPALQPTVYVVPSSPAAELKRWAHIYKGRKEHA